MAVLTPPFQKSANFEFSFFKSNCLFFDMSVVAKQIVDKKIVVVFGKRIFRSRIFLESDLPFLKLFHLLKAQLGNKDSLSSVVFCSIKFGPFEQLSGIETQNSLNLWKKEV